MPVEPSEKISIIPVIKREEKVLINQRKRHKQQKREEKEEKKEGKVNIKV